MKIKFTLAFLLVFVLSPLAGFSQEFGAKKPIYTFSDVLAQALVLRESAEGDLQGEWRGGRFQFEGLTEVADVFAKSQTSVGGVTRSAISIQPLEGFDSTVNFSRVTPGRTLRIFYALPDEVREAPQVAPVQFEVWLGEKKLFETSLTSKGWQEAAIDLTLPFLLNRSYQIRFSVRPVGEGSIGFLFDAQIE